MCWYRFSTRLLATIESPVAKNATSRLMRCRSAGASLRLRSTMSSEKSISSTVHVLRMASRYMSKNCGYRIGRSVSSKPGSRMLPRLGVPSAAGSVWSAPSGSGSRRGGANSVSGWTSAMRVLCRSWASWCQRRLIRRLRRSRGSRASTPPPRQPQRQASLRQSHRAAARPQPTPPLAAEPHRALSRWWSG